MSSLWTLLGGLWSLSKGASAAEKAERTGKSYEAGSSFYVQYKYINMYIILLLPLVYVQEQCGAHSLKTPPFINHLLTSSWADNLSFLELEIPRAVLT